MCISLELGAAGHFNLVPLWCLARELSHTHHQGTAVAARLFRVWLWRALNAQAPSHAFEEEGKPFYLWYKQPKADYLM